MMGSSAGFHPDTETRKATEEFVQILPAPAAPYRSVAVDRPDETRRTGRLRRWRHWGR
jgi:hypothetical protein